MACFCYNLKQGVNTFKKKKKCSAWKEVRKAHLLSSHLAGDRSPNSPYFFFMIYNRLCKQPENLGEGLWQGLCLWTRFCCVWGKVFSFWFQSAFLTEKRGKHFFPHRCFHTPAACQEMLGLWCQPQCRQNTTMHRLKKLNKWPWNGLEMWLSICPVCTGPGFYPQLCRKEERNGCNI